MSAVRGVFTCRTSSGETVKCRARGKFLLDKRAFAVGDNVELELRDDENHTIIKRLERRNYLPRPYVANIDTIALVIAAKNPSPDLLSIDRVTVMAVHMGAELILLVNKTDLASPDMLIETYTKAGFTVLPLSAASGYGVDELKPILDGKTVIFTGASGVGKSTILNAIDPTHFNRETGDLNKINRGKHTTTQTMLIPWQNGFVADTPGYSCFDLNPSHYEPLRDCFPEFAPYNDICSFKGCAHINALPKVCAVAAAVNEGKIAVSRYENYVKLLKNEN